jgi:hypothetical protein
LAIRFNLCENCYKSGMHRLPSGESPRRGEARLRGRESCAPLQERERRRLRCARLRRAPRQRRSSPAGASTRSGRASARTLSRCALHDAQPPPSPFVGGGKTAASGARASGAHPDRDAPAPQGLPRAQGGLQPALSRCALHDAQPPPSPFVGGGKTAASGARASGAHPGRDAPAPQGLPRAQGGLQPAPSLVARSTTPNLPLRLLWAVGKPPPQVRAPPARTPTETLQPRRGFHALREGFSPHPLSLRASRRPTSPFAPCGSRGDEGQPRPLHPSTFLIPSGTSAPLCQIPSTCTIP